MASSLDNLKDRAIQLATTSGKIEDIEKAVTICKVASESENETAEAATRASTLRQEGLKNWAQILVPLLSVITLAVTLLSQTQQQREVEKSRQDLSWRNAIDEFKTASSTKTPVAGVLAQVKLKPFLDSPIYGDQANQLALLVIPRLSDPEAFEDLFESIKWSDPNQFARVIRALNRLDNNLREVLGRLPPEVDTSSPQTASGGTTAKPATAAAPAQPKAPGAGGLNPFSQRDDINEELSRIDAKMSFVCNKMATFIRRGQVPVAGLNLRDGYLLNCDMSNIDLGKADLNNVGLQAVNLTGTNLAGAQTDGLTITNTIWWSAAAIDADLLRPLVESFYPGSDNVNELVKWPTKAEYQGNVRRLCKAAHIDCPDSLIKFSPPSTNGA